MEILKDVDERVKIFEQQAEKNKIQSTYMNLLEVLEEKYK